MSRFLDARFQGLEEYVPGEQPQDQQYIKLNTNESPYPPSQKVQEAAGMEAAKLMLYNDPDGRQLKQTLAEYYQVEPQNVFLSNGSDDILNFAFMAYARRYGVLYPEISYGFYPVFAQLYGVQAETPPLRADLSIDPADYQGKGKMVVLANPNAPTGRALTLGEIEAILQANPDVPVVIDEAYIDFGGQSAVPLVKQYDNLCVSMTFSKSRSMAGARLGFAIAQKAIIGDLEKIKYATNPYNVNRMTQAAGIAAIADSRYYEENCKRIMETRAYTAEKLQALGFAVVPSVANFLFVRSDAIGGLELYEELKKRGILIRHFTTEKIQDYNRITIGTREQMDALIQTIEALLEERK